MTNSDLITKYFPALSSEQQKQFALLGTIYQDWNSQINVISRKDIEFLYERHVLHSLGIAKVVNFKEGASILDIGTGGGFPGIPLAIMFPGCKFHLIDSTGKKIKVVGAVAESLGLKNVVAEQARAEERKEKYDFIVSRGVTSFPVFFNWVKDKFNTGYQSSLANGILYLKGGELGNELEDFAAKVKVFPLSNYFEEEFFATKKVVYLAM